MLSLSDALTVSSRLVAVSVLVQSLELLVLRRVFARRVVVLSALQLALCCGVIVVGASPILLLSFVVYLLVIQALGAPFNGGSDVLSGLSLLCLGLAALERGEGALAHGALAYLGVQTTLSYFIAGVAKLKEAGWRNGRALSHFAGLAKYGVPVWARALIARPVVALGASWVVLLFECSFPLALVSARVAVVYLALGVGFHLANALLFGLNRFLLAWLAVYPVLLWLSEWLGLLRG